MQESELQNHCKNRKQLERASIILTVIGLIILAVTVFFIQGSKHDALIVGVILLAAGAICRLFRKSLVTEAGKQLLESGMNAMGVSKVLGISLGEAERIASYCRYCRYHDSTDNEME